MARLFGPGPVIVRTLLISISPPATPPTSEIVWPFRAGAKIMLSPAFAAPITDRNVPPAPSSAELVTIRSIALTGVARPRAMANRENVSAILAARGGTDRVVVIN